MLASRGPEENFERKIGPYGSSKGKLAVIFFHGFSPDKVPWQDARAGRKNVLGILKTTRELRFRLLGSKVCLHGIIITIHCRAELFIVLLSLVQYGSSANGSAVPEDRGSPVATLKTGSPPLLETSAGYDKIATPGNFFAHEFDTGRGLLRIPFPTARRSLFLTPPRTTPLPHFLECNENFHNEFI